MYSAWKITTTKEEIIIWGNEEKVDEYRKNHLINEDFGGGFGNKTIDEIAAIVDGLKGNHPHAREVKLL